MKRTRKETTAAMRQAVLDAHEGGKKSINQVAKDVGVSWNKAKEILDEALVELTAEIEPTPIEHQPTPIDEHETNKILSELKTESESLVDKAAHEWVDKAAATLDELDPRQGILHRLEESQKALALIDTARNVYGRVPEIESAINAHYCKRVGGA